MNIHLSMLALALLGLAAIPGDDGATDAIWLTDLDEATRIATENDRPLLAAFR